MVTDYAILFPEQGVASRTQQFTLWIQTQRGLSLQALSHCRQYTTPFDSSRFRQIAGSGGAMPAECARIARNDESCRANCSLGR